mmetsp:Transcript_20893/g.49614  ORF Transcript_20893/g.49614 Transcript_20893/m.49614 type:complete len:434 (+) Transcript_20893:327-1628(+)|eukprot:CAMPEP_0113459346 /NCGR_PEP_ID=MMETSP0014_2-20120614/10402_1 /TAXON_ID=2857 /ORGANISM="Nitzschia sp." /LENGTH=433 /DNA_ID=CAMNT_0000350921 /DNA_START=327 /DNA_END=1628 /DNA_ORIENTATION=+ /assembly_acc=CAM_ASM_000159
MIAKMTKKRDLFKSMMLHVMLIVVVVLMVPSPSFLFGSTVGSTVTGYASAFSSLSSSSSNHKTPIIVSTVQRRSWTTHGGIVNRPLSCSSSPSSSLRMTLTELPWSTPLISVASSSSDIASSLDQTNVSVVLSLFQTLVVPLVAFVVVSTVIEKSLYSVFGVSDDNDGGKNKSSDNNIQNNRMESTKNGVDQQQQQLSIESIGKTMKKTLENVQASKPTTTTYMSSSSTVDGDDTRQGENSRRDILFKMGATAASFVLTDALLGAPGGGISGGGGGGAATSTMDLSSATRSQKMISGRFNEQTWNEATKNLIEFIEETQPYRIAKHPELRAWVNVQKAAMESAGFVFETASAAVMTAAAASAVTSRRSSSSTSGNTGKDETEQYDAPTTKKKNEDGSEMLESSSTDLTSSSSINNNIDIDDNIDEEEVEAKRE